jgi:hypothetical protein
MRAGLCGLRTSNAFSSTAKLFGLRQLVAALLQRDLPSVSKSPDGDKSPEDQSGDKSHALQRADK